MRRFGITAGILVIAVAMAAPAYATVVSQLPGGDWSVLPDTTAGGAAEIVTGPGTPPAGTGSLKLSVEAAADRALVGTDLGAPTARPWSALSAEYSTYVPDGSPAAFTPTLRFAGFQAGTQRFTTLSFEPSRNGTVTPGQWQTWTLGPDSIVWQTNATDGFCLQASPCTFSAFVAQYSTGIWGQAQLGIGSGVPGPAEGYADAVTIRDGETVQFTDFDPPAVEPTPTPTAPRPTQSELADTGGRDAPGIGLAGAGLAMLGGALIVMAGLIRRRAIEAGDAR